MSFLSQTALEAIGFRSLGRDVRVSGKASIYNPGRISIGDHARIDDFAVISAGEGGISIGRHVHIAVGVTLVGAAEILIEDFAGVSARSNIYSANDDYSGETMTGPTVPDHLRNVDCRPVRIGRHVVVGAGCVVTPGVTIGEGAAVGSLSLVNKDIPPFEIHGGVPARKLATRRKDMFDLEKRL